MSRTILHPVTAVAVILLVTFVLAGPAFAGSGGEAKAGDGPWYAGAGVSAFRLENQNPVLFDKQSVFGGFVDLGYEFLDNVAVELRLGATDNDTNDYPAGAALLLAPPSPLPFTLELGTDYFFSYMLKAFTSRENQLQIYGLLGGTTARSVSTLSGAPSVFGGTRTRTGLTFGAGLEGFVTDTLSLGGEWVRYMDSASGGGTDFTMDGFSVTLNYHW